MLRGFAGRGKYFIDHFSLKSVIIFCRLYRVLSIGVPAEFYSQRLCTYVSKQSYSH